MNSFKITVVLVAALVVALLGGFIWFVGSENPETPAGYVGYLTQGAVFGQTKYIGLQTGPTSPGRTWLADVLNVSITPYTYTEEFSGDQQVLTKDNLLISFRVHVTFVVRSAEVKNFVEHYSVLHQGSQVGNIVEAAYANFVREPLRTFSRDQVQKHNGLEVKDNITPIGEAIYARIRNLTDTTPFEISTIVVGNIQYPDLVTNAVSMKLAATQDLEREQTNIAIEGKKAEKRVVEAHGIAEAMDVVNKKLTVLYIQHEAIEAQKAMVGSENHTTIYLPVGPMGVPIVGNINLDDVGQPKK
ncbi:MAG: hypothetical protein G01um101420_546 [Parcubacteria group bacterium Gr01-1014_20]|nr:MAG: hypothetical protein G01um101420_546 [Parcubacteria group bacterium Gr01-1014_20]